MSETALSQLSILPETRDEQHRFADKAIQELLNGEYDIVKFWVQASILADTLNEIMDSPQIKYLATKKATEYEGYKVNGCDVKLQTRRKFDFSSCGSTEWEQAKSDEENAKKLRLKAEEFLKVLTYPLANAETGEVVNPPKVSISEFITVR